nr:TRAP transporter large permease [Puniceibacterium sediminis]
MGALFIAGVLPGLMCIVMLMIVAYVQARNGGEAYRETEPFTFARLCRTGWAALPAAGMPILILGGILGGVFTPTEAAAVSGFYGLLVGLFVYGDLDIRKLPNLILRTASLSSAVMLIIGTAALFSWLIANANVPKMLGEWITSVSTSQVVFLIIANLLFLFVGMFLETIAAILIIVPVLSPIAAQMGVDPIHFSLLVILNCAIGTVTPPYGVSLFVASSVAGRPVLSVARRLVWPLSGLFTILLAVTFIPDLPLFLPRLFGLID